MKQSLIICIAVIAIMFTSCNKESIDSKVIKTLTIDAVSHTFVNEDGKHYYENTFNHQQEIQLYKLEMLKGVEYRISASQSDALINQTKLTIVNSAGDTLAESLNEGGSKSFIVIKSPQTANYYVKVGLMQRTNPKFDYRLYFEELVEDAFTFSGLEWQSNGAWNLTSPGTAELTNFDSRIYRHLKLIYPGEGSPDVSFVILSSSSGNPNFGFIMEASDYPLQFSEYAYELSSTGYTFLAFKKENNYTVMTLNSGSMSLEWGLLTGNSIDFSAGVKVDLKYEVSQYVIYLNNTALRSINGSLDNFTILLEDCGDGATTLNDFQLTY